MLTEHQIVVINLAKIKILKQFTTCQPDYEFNKCCYQSCKDKNFKAIHNNLPFETLRYLVVINLAKIKILKQFTTNLVSAYSLYSCYQSCKDKNFKAIHNHDFATNNLQAVVINLAKIKILKQFTTSAAHASALSGCYQSCKDKNFKAIHNMIFSSYMDSELLSILQR